MSSPDFWSRRKAAVEAERREQEAREAAARAESDRAALAERPEAEVLQELGLPDPDTLGEGADFSAFLESRVPEAIRRRALRRLWRSNPVLANLDGLNDYDDDYTQAAAPGALKTAYRIGQGFLRDLPKDPAQPDLAPDAAPESVDTAETPPEIEVALADPTPERGGDEMAEPVSEAPQEVPLRSARKLRFHFLD